MTEEEDLVKKLKLLNSLRSGDITTLLKSDIPPVGYHLEKFIPEGMITTIFGPTNTYKSTMSIAIALCIATGKDFLTFKNNKPGKILWIDEEMDIVGLKQKILQVCNGLDINPDDLLGKFYYMSMRDVKLDTAEGRAVIEYHAQKHQIDIVFVDSMSKIMSGDENQARDVSKLMHDLRMVTAKFGVGYILIHHAGKDVSKKMRGSSEFSSQSDCSYSVSIVGNGKVKLTPDKGRHLVGREESINFQVTGSEQRIDLTYIGLAKDETKKHALQQREKLISRMTNWFTENAKEEYKFSDYKDDWCNYLSDCSEDALRDILYRDTKLPTMKSNGLITYNKKERGNGYITFHLTPLKKDQNDNDKIGDIYL